MSDHRSVPYWQTFENEPHTDFAQEQNREMFAAALQMVQQQLSQHYPLMIGGEAVETEEQIVSRDPSHKETVVGTAASASAADADRAITAAREAWPDWARRDVAERAECLRRAAEAMRSRRFELAAWMVYECAKGWREADADVAEAIDFCDYYAAGAEYMWREHGMSVPGEENTFTYYPRGVAAIISPWNFPLAILTGMTAAALVTGNTVVIKPAEQSPVIAAKLFEVLQEIELPPGVADFLPGPGDVAGARLVEHDDVNLIAFTGSRQVGLTINAKAAEVSRGLHWGVKKVIAEMGGKNAIIIDDDADLDEAVAGVVQSAFGFQGQKCSACSRVVALDAVHDAFLERLVPAVQSLHIGPAENPASKVGPVIDDQALAKVLRYIEIGRQEGRQVLSIDVVPLASRGYFVGPHIFADIVPSARLAQEEVFGPVLAVMRAKNLDEAFAIANGTEYALTGAIYSRSPANLERARNEFLVGNLYLNCGSTGAMVGRQPFGGFRLSGIGNKAGGPDYLQQFVVPRTITENTMRRGFAPE